MDNVKFNVKLMFCLFMMKDEGTEGIGLMDLGPKMCTPFFLVVHDILMLTRRIVIFWKQRVGNLNKEVIYSVRTQLNILR